MKVVINQGTTFQVSDEKGDILPGQEYGLYYQDTRFLSRLKLTVNQKELLLLSSNPVDHYSAIYYLTNPELGEIKPNSLSIIRRKFVGDGLHEDVDITNHSSKTVNLRVEFELGADFADIFEIKRLNFEKEGKTEISKTPQGINFKYVHGDFVRLTMAVFQSMVTPQVINNRVLFELSLAPRETWHTCTDFKVGEEQKLEKVQFKCDSFGLLSLPVKEEMEKWFADVPKLKADLDDLNHAYQQSLKDLIALRIRDIKLSPDLFIPAAGIPWFSTLFGRDSLITAYQIMPVTPEIAGGTLKILAEYQGREINKFKEEEPGKILHEIRFGELAYLGRIPHTPYYGTIDATPLFLILACEYFRYTGDKALIAGILPNLKAALEWLDKYGDRDNDGYLEYQRATGQGLENQGWKDSWDSISFIDGRLAEPPIALAEVQGYVYKAKQELSRLFAQFGEPELSKRLQKEAGELKERFNRDFWLPGEQFFALALDKAKQKVDAPASNCGQLLWSRIVDEDKAGYLVKRLMSEEFYSGWGIRTLSTKAAAYNPISYHNGSVWPFDNSLIAEGFRNYGFDIPAKKVIKAMIDASSYFPHHRLPELFCGYPRESGPFPVEYPTSSSPQAWSTGAIILFLKTLLGLRPDPKEMDTFWIDPILPEGMSELVLENIAFKAGSFNLKVDRAKGVELEITGGKIEVKTGKDILEKIR